MDSQKYNIVGLKNDLSKFGCVFNNPVVVKIENPKEKAEYILSQYLGKFEQLPEYELIYKWLEDNKGRGLLMCGSCGRGKSLFGRIVIPSLLLRDMNLCCNVVNATEIATKIKEISQKRIIYIDDIGRESESVEYGNRLDAMPYLVDLAEQTSKMLIISTNLTAVEIKERYGERTLDRLKAIMSVVSFKGESMRK